MVADFYARLGVAPEADTAAIEAALQRKQPEWSMGTRNPKTRHANQLFLDEIPALRRALLGDPTSRAAYDAELAMVRSAARDRKIDELQRRIRLRAAKGGLSASDRQLLVGEAAKLGLGEDELARLMRPIPNLVEAPSPNGEIDFDQDPKADVLDPSTRRQIQVALEHLGCRDLYDALGVARDSPASYIASRADAERQRWMKKTQVTAQKTAWLELITHAQSHLSSPKARARYDRTLALEAEDFFEGLVEFALKGLNRIDLGTHSALTEEAAAVGISSDRADRLITRMCRRLRVERQVGSVEPFGPPSSSTAPGLLNGAAKFTLLRCQQCLGVTEMSPVARKAGSARCRHCGASLKWNCPVCRANLWVDERRCACGFRLAFREPLLRHFEAAQCAFRNFDLERSLEHLARVQELAPKLAGARKGVAMVRERQADIARFKLAYETASAGNKLVAARAALDAWGRLVDPKSPDLQVARSELTRHLTRAEALAARARTLERTDQSAARALYRQCLTIASDLPEAITGLSRTPPDPPSALDAQVMGDRIRLSWMPPPPDGLGALTFVVMRKRGGVLEHPGDGTRIAEISTSEFDDTHVTPGDTVAYAVVSKRGGVESVAAISLGAFLFLADVKDVRVEFRHNEVELTWLPPRGVSEIRVIRKRGAPPKDPRDGDRLAPGLEHALDRNLDPDEVYYYGIYAIYKMADGRLFPAPGVVVSARPQPPIPPVEAPRLLQEPSGLVRIDWIEPVRGSVRILRTLSPLPLLAGNRLTAAELEALEGHWIEPTAPDRAYDPDFPREGHCYYTPLAAWAGSWTVGHGVALSRVPDPTELCATRSGGGLGSASTGIRATLRWRWPPTAGASLVVARQGAPPQGPSDPAAISATITRAEYDRQDCWMLNVPARRTDLASVTGIPRDSLPPGETPSSDGSWHIRVYSIAELEGVRAISPGLESTAATTLPAPHPDVTVSYVLKRPWLPGLPWSVTFRTQPPGTALPPMVLVAHPRAVPLSVDDGYIVARFPAPCDGARLPIPVPMNASLHGARVFLDPHLEPDALLPIRLRHPETGITRV
jgi:hypothetical protein